MNKIKFKPYPKNALSKYSINLIGRIHSKLKNNTNTIMKSIFYNIYIPPKRNVSILDISYFDIFPTFHYDYLLSGILMERFMGGFKK